MSLSANIFLISSDFFHSLFFLASSRSATSLFISSYENPPSLSLPPPGGGGGEGGGVFIFLATSLYSHLDESTEKRPGMYPNPLKNSSTSVAVSKEIPLSI